MTRKTDTEQEKTLYIKVSEKIYIITKLNCLESLESYGKVNKKRFNTKKKECQKKQGIVTPTGKLLKLFVTFKF